MNSNQLRYAIKELTEEIQSSADKEDWIRCDELEIELEELIRELNLKDRSAYYSIEK